MPRNPYGRMTPARAAQMMESFSPADREWYGEVVRLLTDDPAHSSASADDDEMPDEFAALWPGAAADRQAEMAASARRAWDDNEIYRRLFPDDEDGE